jgi:hypothetical protein
MVTDVNYGIYSPHEFLEMVCDVNYNVGQLACNLSLKIKKKIKNMYGLSVRIFCIPTFNKFYYLCNKFLFYIILFIVISHRKKKNIKNITGLLFITCYDFFYSICSHNYNHHIN